MTLWGERAEGEWAMTDEAAPYGLLPYGVKRLQELQSPQCKGISAWACQTNDEPFGESRHFCMGVSNQ